ncbi:helix-turn-helix domain-containing protein [Bosea sp. ANAM02]|uniref:helix-turn-helix transcriptional regulator n=1 Tax=Bosea sp. ANAM02 TaxID=2020412 RepID=UPI0015634343|nr:helix-turn-helix domain-containing protein [Bosea sp. ANAM02]
MNDISSLAAAIKAARVERGLRQDDLALAAGINRKTLMTVEGGVSDRDPGLSNLMRIMHQLGLELVLQPARADQPNVKNLMAEADALGLRLEPRTGSGRSLADLARDAGDLGFDLVPTDVDLAPDASELALARRIAAKRRGALAQLPDDPPPAAKEIELDVDDGYGFDDDGDAYAPRGMR